MKKRIGVARVIISTGASFEKKALMPEPEALTERAPKISIHPLALNLTSRLVGIYKISLAGLFNE